MAFDYSKFFPGFGKEEEEKEEFDYSKFLPPGGISGGMQATTPSPSDSSFGNRVKFAGQTLGAGASGFASDLAEAGNFLHGVSPVGIAHKAFGVPDPVGAMVEDVSGRMSGVTERATDRAIDTGTEIGLSPGVIARNVYLGRLAPEILDVAGGAAGAAKLAARRAGKIAPKVPFRAHPEMDAEDLAAFGKVNRGIENMGRTPPTDEVDLSGLISGLKKGSPGPSVETPNPFNVDVIWRNSDGEPKANLRITKDPETGNIIGQEIYTDPEFRRQNIATKLYGYAEDLGYPVKKSIGATTLTEQGKHFTDSLDVSPRRKEFLKLSSEALENAKDTRKLGPPSATSHHSIERTADAEKLRYVSRSPTSGEAIGIMEVDLKNPSKYRLGVAGTDEGVEMSPKVIDELEAELLDASMADGVIPGGENFRRKFSKPRGSTRVRGLVTKEKWPGWFKQNVTSWGKYGVPKDIGRKLLDEKVYESGEQAAEMFKFTRNIGELEISALKQGRGLDSSIGKDAALESAWKFITGEAPLETVPEGMRVAALNIRAHADNLSKSMVDEGFVEGNLAEIFKSHYGEYLTARYDAFQNPKHLEQVRGTDRWNTALKWVTDNNVTDDGVQLVPDPEAYLIDFVRRNPDAPKHIAEGSRHLSRADTTIFMKKHRLPKELEAVLGPHTTQEKYFDTVTAVAKDLSIFRTEQTLLDTLHGSMIFDVRAKPDLVESVLEGPLKGKWVDPKLYNALMELHDNKAVGNLWKSFNHLFKANYTVFSPTPTGIRNISSYFGMELTNGHLFGGPSTVKAVDKSLEALRVVGLGKNKLFKPREIPDEAAQEIDRLLKLGVFHQGTIGREIDRYATTFNKINRGRGEGFGPYSRAIKHAAQYYMGGDNAGRGSAFYHELDTLQRAFPDRSIADLEREAASRVHATIPTWEATTNLTKTLRDNALISMFPTFWADLMRTQKNIVGVIGQEMASGNPVLMASGAKRLAGMMTVYSLPVTGTIAAGMWLGKTVEEIKETQDFIRTTSPHWDKNSVFIPIRINKERTDYVNLTHLLIPQSAFMEPFIALIGGKLTEEEAETKAWEALMSAGDPFTGTEAMAALAVEQSTGRKNTGAPAWNDRAPLASRAALRAKRAAYAAAPTSVKQVGKLLRANDFILSNNSQYGEKLDPNLEAFTTLTGIKIQTIPHKIKMGFITREYNEETRKIKKHAVDMIKDQRNKSPKKKLDAQTFVQQEYLKEQEQFRAIIKVYQGRGYDYDEMFDMLVDGNVSKKDAESLLNGEDILFDFSKYYEQEGF